MDHYRRRLLDGEHLDADVVGSRGAVSVQPRLDGQAITDHTDLTLFERNIALLAGVRDDTLVPRASFFQLDQVRKARGRGLPRHLLAHEDLLVFRRPDAPTRSVAAAATPAREAA